MSPERAADRRLWSDPIYERLPLPPLALGALVAALLVGLVALLGQLAELTTSEGVVWWQTREGRLSVLLALLAPAVPTALRYHELGTRRDLEALGRSTLWRGAPPPLLRRATSGDPRRALVVGLSAFVFVPLVAYTVDRDPTLYLRSDYWAIGQIWAWGVGLFVAFFGAILTYRVTVDARTFAALARALPEVDLLDREDLLPFARQGLRSAVPGLLLLTFLALNAVDEAFFAAIVLFGMAALVQNVALLLIPIRSLRDRLREAKHEELARVNGALRGETGALQGSPVGRREAPTLTDLLAWRAFVESVPEWPIDASTLGRFALYVGLPLLSWVGAALVERAVDAVIG